MGPFLSSSERGALIYKIYEKPGIAKRYLTMCRSQDVVDSTGSDPTFSRIIFYAMHIFPSYYTVNIIINKSSIVLAIYSH